MYASVEFPDEQISSQYFVEKITQLLETQTSKAMIKIANSKIFPVISREALKEFLKLNKRNKIMQLNEVIEKMFVEAKFDEIIDNLEDFVDSQKLVDYFKLSYVFFKYIYVNLL